MSKWIPVLLAGELALASACTHRVVSSGPYVWQLRGAVVSVDDTILHVRHKSGQVVDLQIDDRTLFTRNKRPDSRQSLLRGTRVVVDVESLRRGVYRARLVQIFGGGTPSASSSEAAPATTMFPHDDSTAWWLSGQVNLIEQTHGSFPALYSGPHSFLPTSERTISRVLTLYTGLRLGHGWEAFVDVESAGGRGLSDAVGLAGFTDLDVVRNPTLGSTPYLARLMARKVVALSQRQVDVTPMPLAVAPHLPARRLEIRAGKLGIVDFFDVNAVGNDSHLQFTNWTVDNNGAYDYAADTRGYTYGLIVEYDTPRWNLRGAEALMPTVANGIVLDWKVARARGENVELELHPTTAFTLRLLGYANHADMGSYTDAIDAFRAGRDPTPNIEAHRQRGRTKYGVGANAEHTMPDGIRLFARTGWNSGDTESFAYTEVNNSAAIGGDVAGVHWRRPLDRVGVAMVSNGLSGPHRDYLALGGLGFLLGDGGLTYGRESIVETYYTAHVWRGVSASGGLQYIDHPGYNRDRGPVLVEMLRLHMEF